MQGAEASDQRCERVDGERRQRDEVERAGVERPDRAHGIEHDRPLPEHPARRPLERTARVGDDDGPADPVEEPHAELRLEPPDSFGERRLGHTERRRPGGEAAFVDDGEDVLDLAKLHRPPFVATGAVPGVRPARLIGISNDIGSLQRLEQCGRRAVQWGVALHILLGALLIGAGVGFLSGAFGKGGSAVSTPLLHVLGVPAIVAIASPLPATIPATWLASRRYAREGHVDRRVLRVGMIVGIPVTALGAFLTRWIAGEPLVLATDVILLVLGVRVLLGAHTPADTDGADAGTDDADLEAPASRLRTVLVVSAAGMVSGLLGNSGGFLLAPLFMNVLRMPVRRALGTSLALATALAVPGTLVHAWLGHIDWSLSLVLGCASIPFATLGAAAALRMRERSLTVAYGVGIAMLSGGLLVFAR